MRKVRSSRASSSSSSLSVAASTSSTLALSRTRPWLTLKICRGWGATTGAGEDSPQGRRIARQVAPCVPPPHLCDVREVEALITGEYVGRLQKLWDSHGAGSGEGGSGALGRVDDRQSIQAALVCIEAVKYVEIDFTAAEGGVGRRAVSQRRTPPPSEAIPAAGLQLHPSPHRLLACL
jgi:hypothetical protein